MASRTMIQDLWATSAVARLFAHSGIGFAIVSPDRKLVDVNQTYCNMLGYSREELLQLTIADLTHPDDQKMTTKLFQSAERTNLVQTFEKRYVAKNGDAVWIRGRSEPLTDDEGGTYRIVMLENITARKQTELFLKQMAAIVNASDDAIFRSNIQGNIEFWSKGAERLYGYTAAEAVGRSAGFIAANPYTPEEMAGIRKLMQGQVLKQSHAQSRHKDGHIIDVSVLIFPLKNNKDEVVAFAAVHRDISELRHLGEQLRLSQRMETAGMLAGGIAHDFNNILTVIKGSCDVLAQEMPELLQGRHLEMIERSADKAASLTRQLLTFSRRQKISPEILDPNAMLENLRTIMQRTLGEDVALATNLQSSWQIREDPTQLEQIILNVSVNARSAMPKGGKLLIDTLDFTMTEAGLSSDAGWVSYTPEPIKPGDYVMISITDNGVGMGREVLERIFEPFFTTKAKGQGTGLGLAVVYGMVTQVGGGIHVISREGIGTIFQIFLPRVLEAPKVVESQSATVQSSGKRKVLVVDDDNNVRGLVVRVLEVAGFEITQAESAEQVLKNPQLADVDLIVSDVVMPGLTGPEFSELWLKEHPTARFLFISGYIENASQTDILQAGNFLAKPFKPSALVEKVEAMLAARPSQYQIGK